MSKIAVVYWSGTGNTEAMAEYQNNQNNKNSGTKTTTAKS